MLKKRPRGSWRHQRKLILHLSIEKINTTSFNSICLSFWGFWCFYFLFLVYTCDFFWSSSIVTSAHSFLMWRNGVSEVRTPTPAYNMQYHYRLSYHYIYNIFPLKKGICLSFYFTLRKSSVLCTQLWKLIYLAPWDSNER